MRGGCVLEHAHEDPAHVGEEQAARTEVRVPLNLDRVRDIQTLDGTFGVEDQHGDTGVTVEVGEAKASTAVELLGRIAAWPERLLPKHRLAGESHGHTTAEVAGTVGIASARVPALERA